MSNLYRKVRQRLAWQEEVARIQEVVNEERILFDLSEWNITVKYAPEFSDLETMMLEGDYIAVITDSDPASKTAEIAFCQNNLREQMEKDISPGEEAIYQVVDHELGHLILNPYGYSGKFQTGAPLEETQATHIAYACAMLREEKWLPEPEDDLVALIEKAHLVCHLDKNNWRVRVKMRDRLIRFERRLPAFAHSLFYKNHTHLALLSARDILFEVDRHLIEEHLPSIVLREMWRVVLNPYGSPCIRVVGERKLDHIMHAMRALGWR